MPNLNMSVEHGAIKFGTGYRMNDEAIGNLPADVKQFLADRMRKLYNEAESEDLFEVTITSYVKEQVEHLWSSRLASEFNAKYGEGAWEAIVNTVVREGTDKDDPVTLEGLDVYFYRNKPITTSIVRVYATNAIDAGRKAKELLTNVEDARVIGVSLIVSKKSK